MRIVAGWLTLPPDLHLRDLWQQTGGGVRMLSLRRCGGTLLRLSNAVKLGATSTECVVAGGFCTFNGYLGAGKGVFMSWDMLVPPWPSVGLALRSLSTPSSPQRGDSPGDFKKGKDALMIDQDDFNAITDKIPQKPMTAAEGVSYTAIILAAFGVLAAISWAFVSNYILDPAEYVCFNLTLEKLRQDPRITVRLGESIKGYGGDSPHRWQRTRIPHKSYKDSKGLEHLQIQFHIKGRGGVGIVYADMHQDGGKEWQYSYLYVDFQHGGTSQRVVIVRPQV